MSGVFAQGDTAQQGDPPIASLISVSIPDDDGIVTISGGAGAVFPAAQVAIRNLYTHETVYTTAGITGSFSVEIYGPGNTPFQISPATAIPADLRGLRGSLPGGPSTIIYGIAPKPRQQSTTTELLIDGHLDDWVAYPDTQLTDSVFAFKNSHSLYLALTDFLPDEDELLTMELSLDGISYELTYAMSDELTIQRNSTPPAQPFSLPASVVVDIEAQVVEMRFAWEIDVENAIFERLYVHTDGEETEILKEFVIETPIVVSDEQDGFVYPDGKMQGDFTGFYVAGLLEGASYWEANGRINTLNIQPDEHLIVELDTEFILSEDTRLPEVLTGELWLQPVTINDDGGAKYVSAMHTNNGWSSMTTDSGLAIDNLRGDVYVEAVSIPPAQIIRRGESLFASFRFDTVLPRHLPDGFYVPVFKGNFSPEDTISRLPVVMNVGAVKDTRLLWTLFHDNPSDGSRGILAEEDSPLAALSNRVRFNSPTYILPPGEYPLEPYLLNQLPNRYDMSFAPLLPLLFPGGRLNGKVTLPDGSVDDLTDTPISQNRLSTIAIDERDRFGGQSPVDAYRLTTANPIYNAYNFEQFGEYEIELTGHVEDTTGHRYAGGGTYRVLIANHLDFSPGVLSGTSFHVGDTFFLGGRVSPPVPAELTGKLKIYTDDDVIEHEFSGQADKYGYFDLSDYDYQFEAQGEYIVDYEIRYTDDEDVLWAASMRGAGVVADESNNFIAHGARGIADNTQDLYRPAWFNTSQYPPPELSLDVSERPYYPYHSGDVAVIQDSFNGGLRPIMQIQDIKGSYSDWFLANVASDRSVERQVVMDEIPVMPVLGGPFGDYGTALLPGFVVNEAYSYISAVRPDVTVRQFVLGQQDDLLPLHWDGNDTYNQQIGAGLEGDRPGDYIFLFGGTVVRNGETGIKEVSAYASVATVIDEESSAGVYPPYGGATGRGYSDALTSDGLDVFFHPTAIRPGQVLVEGSDFVVAGQVAPTLTSQVDMYLTAPNDDMTHFSDVTSAIGYYYNPEHRMTLDQTGIWKVEIIVTPIGPSSFGLPEDPLPIGGVPGARNRQFAIYVVPEDAVTLDWGEENNVDREFRPGVLTNFALNVPTEWSQVQVHYTVSTPSYILEAGTIQPTGRTVSYQLNAVNLSDAYPNFESSGLGEGPSASDVLTLTFAITGVDGNDESVIQTRTITIFHDRLRSFDER